MNVYEQVEKNIDELVDNNVDWSACATSEEMHNAREGKLSIKFFDKEVPADWLKDNKDVILNCNRLDKKRRGMLNLYYYSPEIYQITYRIYASIIGDK